MKKAKKFLVGLLAFASVSAFALGVAACGDDNTGNHTPPTEKTEIEQVYDSYVAYATAQGQTTLDYETWLATIQGAKGDKGDKGETGAQGEQGPQGATGVGIESVEFDENGDLLITYTDGSTQTVELPQSNEPIHAYGEWIHFTTDDVPCEERLFYQVCEDCNHVEWKKGAYTDHDWDTVTTPPTCQEQGYDTKTCSVCGKVEIENYTAISDHTWEDEYRFDNSFHWIKCQNCTATKDSAEHDIDESGYCTVCEQPLAPTEGILYDVSADGTYAEVIGYEGTATKIVIADEYNNLPVQNIYDRAFYDKTIISVVIPDSVTTIGSYAFGECISLTDITLGERVSKIENDAFYWCDEIKNIYYTGNIAGWCSVTFSGMYTNPVTGDNAFNDINLYIDNQLIAGELVIPESVEIINDYAFDNYDNLTSVTIGDSVTTIGEYAFSRCNNLESVTIGDSATMIESSAFSGCDKLQFNEYENCIYLGSADNPYYALIETVTDTYSSYEIHTQTKIIANNAFSSCERLINITIPDSVTAIGNAAFDNCNNLTSITIPDSVTTIGSSAFCDCDGLTSITIPDSVITIGDRAFIDCDNLTSVTIGNSVTTIGEYAFYNCDGLTSVYYTGMPSEWEEIEKGYNWKGNITEVVGSNWKLDLESGATAWY